MTPTVDPEGEKCCSNKEIRVKKTCVWRCHKMLVVSRNNFVPCAYHDAFT